MLKKGAGVVLRESWREFWRRQTVVITMDKLGVPRPVQYALPWIRYIRAEVDKELEEEEKAKEQALNDQEVAQTAIAPSRKLPDGVEPLYKQYRCWCGDPLSCHWPQDTVQQDPESKYCLECSFPATLAEKSEIRGSRGRYRVEGLLSRRGLGRLYQGIQLSDSQRVVIKEYLLPDRCFNQEEAQARKQAFKRLAGMSLADGRVLDFRLSHLWEAIADANEERCYLLTKGNLDLYPTLSDYLALYGPMNAIAVRQVLNQVLQTLEFLHSQKFRLPSGQVQQGLAHGNLSLNSLLFASNQKTGVRSENGASSPNGLNNSASWTLDSEFFIYLCDLALWESLFDPSTLEISNPSPSQDLVALGYVGFYLLAGSTVNPTNGQPLNPKDDQQWPQVNFALKAFLLRLMGIGIPFESAEAARQALLKLPPEKPIAVAVVQVVAEDPDKVKTYRRPLFFLLGTLGLVMLGGLIWFLIRQPYKSDTASDEILPCCIKEVPAVPSGKFTYTTESESTWSYVLGEENLVVQGQTLESELTRRQRKLQLSYQPETSDEAAIEKVRSEQVDFALTALVRGLPPDLEYKEVAYDGLVVFVAFSYSKRDKGLPQALNGEITFENLRKLYTGQITNWKEIGGPDLQVKLYIPDDTEAVRIFEQRVLKDNQQIELFRSLQRKGNQSLPLVKTSWVPEIIRLSTFEMLRKVIQDFEDEQVGAIAFGTLSRVFGQCSVYPLALRDRENSPVQALAQDNGQPVNPTTDLCNDKGSYRPNVEVFKTERYPLAYPLAVVYPRDNSRPPVGAKFAEMLRTQEGQQMLSKTGLIPLQPLPPN